MKKNAIVISILFAAGCASNPTDYSTKTNEHYAAPTSDLALSRDTEMITPSDPSLSAQQDPAMGAFRADVLGTGSSNPGMASSVTDGGYRADSSVRGGSNGARGWDPRANLRVEGPPVPLNPALQADSSVRGGSPVARQSDWYSHGPVEINSGVNSGIKADSSIRGGSKGTRNLNSSSQNSSAVATSDSSAPIAADDLLTDGVRSQAFPPSSQISGPNDDLSALSNSFSASSESSSAPNRTDHNGNTRIDADSGILQTPDSAHLSTSENSGSSVAVGGPGSTETGAASSFNLDGGTSLSDSITGEDGDFAREVKTILIRETTGTSGVTQRDVARDVQVTSRGGNVVLKGTVPDQKAKDVLEIRTREISGVHHVDNQLRMATPSNSALRDLGLGRDLEDTTGQLHTVNPQP